MSSLEAMIATAGESPLINSLDFTIPPASTAIVDRRQHKRAYPTSASTLGYTGGAVRTVRLRLGGDAFIDPHSIRLMFTINETGGQANTALAPSCGPWGVWGQVYLRSSGCEVDNIAAYGRHHQQFLWNQATQEQQFGEDGIAGLAGSWNNNGTPNIGLIPRGLSYTVMHKLGLSLFSAGKMLPVRYAPLELELSLVNVATDWLKTGNNGTGTTYSTAFTISNIQLLYDEVVPDESVADTFYRSLLASRVLTIPCLTAYMVSQALNPGQSIFSFSCVRAFSRLSHVYLTFQDASGTAPKSSNFLCPTAITDNSGATPLLSDAAATGASNSPTARLSIGSKYWPDPQPCQTIGEHFYMLQKSLPNIPNLTRDQYVQNAFTIAFDCRKVPEDPTSSVSTRSGDLLRVDLTNLTGTATVVWMTIFAFSVVSVREQGITLLN